MAAAAMVAITAFVFRVMDWLLSAMLGASVMHRCCARIACSDRAPRWRAPRMRDRRSIGASAAGTQPHEEDTDAVDRAALLGEAAHCHVVRPAGVVDADAVAAGDGDRRADATDHVGGPFLLQHHERITPGIELAVLRDPLDAGVVVALQVALVVQALRVDAVLGLGSLKNPGWKFSTTARIWISWFSGRMRLLPGRWMTTCGVFAGISP